MKIILFILVVFAIAVTVIKGYSDDELWKAFKQKHKLNYNIKVDGGKQERMRKNNFLAQKTRVTEHNSKNTFLKNLNVFSVMNPREKEKFLGIKASLVPSAKFMESIKNVFHSRELPPLSLDYRYDFCLSGIRSQGGCGSCWAFSAIAPLEFSRCRKTNVITVLSEQQLVDCDTSNSGCNGGWYVNAWNYLQANSSAKRPLYPYAATKGSCKLTTSMIEAGVSNFDYVQSKNATAMQFALIQYGPLAVAMTVINSFYSYAGGVYDDPGCDRKAVNHGVVIVGYGTLNGIDFWVVRNSWGTSWGLSGYARIQRGVNKCGIETYPAFVVAAD